MPGHVSQLTRKPSVVAKSVPIAGGCAPGFEPIVDAFLDNFAERGELGAATCAIVEGKVVADLRAGTAGDDPARPWKANTIVNAYSVAKPLAATCVLVLVERGRLRLDDCVATYWPEFAAGGKGQVTVRQVLAHQAGLDLFEQALQPEALLDWQTATALLASSPPRWAPGSTHGEHAAFYGHLVGELVRRVDGRTLGTFLREEIARPWRLDFHVGLNGAEAARTADVVDPGGDCREEALSRGETFRLAVDNPPAMLDPNVVNGEVWRRAEIPAVNGHGTALALARFYAGLGAGGVLDGVRLLSDDLVAEATRPQRVGHDEVLDEEVSWGLGFGIADGGFGMGGLGGSLGWWAGEGYAVAYVTRRLGGFERCEAVENTLRRCLGLSGVTV